MKFKIKEVRTDKGAKRQQLSVWDFGPERAKKTLRFSTSKDLFEELESLKRLEERLERGEPEDAHSLTFDSIVSDYMERQSATYSAGWQKNQSGHWRQLKSLVVNRETSETLAQKRASEVNPDTLKTIEKHLLATGNKQRTVNIKLQFVRSVLSFAHEMGKLDKNKLSKFKFTKPAKREIDFWDLEDAQDFLAFAKEKYQNKNQWLFVAYLVMINTGLRAGELWALKPRCLRFERGLIKIDEQYDRVSKTFTAPKGKGPRVVPMNADVSLALRGFIGSKRLGRNDLIFSNSKGRPVDHDNFYSRVFKKEFGAKEGQWSGPEITFHGLRHTNATLMLNAGVDVKTVQEILGHADISTTMRYVHALRSNVERASKLFSVSPQAERRLKLVTENV